MTDEGPFAGAVIVAAGRGERFGDRGKVLATAAGKPLLCWSVEAALAARVVSEVVVVAGAHSLRSIQETLSRYFPEQPITVCLGGERRQDSVVAGIAQLPASIEVAIIHDAARPLAMPAMFDAVGKEALEVGAAITGAPVTDTIKEVGDQRVIRTVERASLWSAQTPQAFRLALLREAFAATATTEREFTDEAAPLEQLGYPVSIVEGAGANLKVTIPEDLDIADCLLTKRSERNRHVSP